MATASPPDYLNWERQLWDGGYQAIAGVDEVGRGALAGPLVAAAVILPIHEIQSTEMAPLWTTIRDSKVLSHQKRVIIAEGILASGAHVSIAEITCEEIDAIGIGPANRSAMERAVNALPQSPDMLLIDAMTIDLDTPQIGVIDGDAQSLSIAAASIVAKVHRDTIMMTLADTWPAYGFDRHKGYGVATHVAALTEHGPCPQHRHSFAPVRRSVR
jgi:ribonuclease HII